jgi:hypothetical protein
MNYTTTNFTHVASNKLFTVNSFGFAASALASQATQSTGYSVSTINLYRDGVTGKGTAQTRFRYSIQSGTYSVRLYVGHPTMETSTRVEAEGGAFFGQSGTLAKNVFSTITIPDILVSDGVLDLVFRTPAGYSGYWLVCGLDLAASVSSLPTTAPQRLDGLTFDEHGLEETSTARLSSVSRAGHLLTADVVELTRREAIADWITTGLTPGQILALQNATVQISDLNSEGAFGLAGTRLIQLDDDALGFGWHVGSGPVPTGAVDLGTVMRHELGHILGYGDLDPTTAGDDIMSGTILPGQRRHVPMAGSPADLAAPDNTIPQPTQWNQQERHELVPDSSALQSPDVSLISVDSAEPTANDALSAGSIVKLPAPQRTLTRQLLTADSEAQAAVPASLDLLDDLFGNPLEGLFE